MRRDELVTVDSGRAGASAPTWTSSRGVAATCTGYNVVQQPDEPPLDLSRPLLQQRSRWARSTEYSKRLMTRIPLRWNTGFHRELNAAGAEPDPELLLVHLHRADYHLCLRRHRASSARKWAEEDLRWNLGWHQRITDPIEFHEWFYGADAIEARPWSRSPSAFATCSEASPA